MNKVSGKFVNIYLSFFAIAYLYSMLITGYLGLVPSGVFSYLVADGWCDSQVQGVGKHCFSDFYYPILSSDMSNPWSGSPNPNPPLTNYYYKLLAPISENGRAGLIVYFTFLLITFSAPFIYLVKKKQLTISTFFFLIFIIITSAPMLIAIDRGSFSLLLFPMIFFLYESYSLKNEKLTNVFLIALVLLKPQMFFFNFILLGRYNFLRFIRLVLCEIILFALSFLLYPSHLLSAIKDYLRQSLSYQNIIPWGELYPTNLSITNPFGALFGNMQSYIALGALRSVMTLIIFLPIIYKILKYRKQINNLELFTYIIFITLFMPGVTYAYYLTLLFVPLLIGAVIWESGVTSGLNFLFRSKLLKYLGAISLILLFIPWTIPWSIILADSSNKLTLTGINWLPGIILLQLYFIVLIRNLGKVITR
jgi:hypothetical protein